MFGCCGVFVLCFAEWYVDVDIISNVLKSMFFVFQGMMQGLYRADVV